MGPLLLLVLLGRCRAAPSSHTQRQEDDAALGALLRYINGSAAAGGVCAVDATCAADPSWLAAAPGVVLLLLQNPTSARFCTGALLHTPHLSAAAAAAGRQPPTFILTAAHCRGWDSLQDAATSAAVVFNHRAPSCTGAGGASSGDARGSRRLLASHAAAAAGGGHGRRHSAAATPPPGTPQVLRGLRVAWQDAASDVLLLRLDSAIPPGFGAAQLGWNASAWAPPATDVATLSHPRGDLLKFSAAEGLGQAQLRFVPAADGGTATGPTHYKLTWAQGGSDTGSSGAPLLDAASQQVLGVLTGGELATCHNTDYFGSLRAAWERGLWQVLSPAGPDAVTGAPAAGAAAVAAGLPGLVVSPAGLVLSEGSAAAGNLWVRLSAPLARGQQLSVAVAAAAGRPSTAQQAAQLGGDAAMPPPWLSLSPGSLLFDSSNWAEEQAVRVAVPLDTASQLSPPASFDLLLSPTIDGGGALRMPLWRRTSSGPTPLSTADQLEYRASITLEAALPQAADAAAPEEAFGSATAAASAAAASAAASATPPPLAVQLGRPVAELEALPPGSVALYSFSSAAPVSLEVQACSGGAQLQVALGPAGGAVTWLGADLCAADASDGPAGCQLAAAGPAGGWCTGFRSLVLPSLSSAGGEPPDPYILAVLPLAASATRSATQSSTVRAELSLTATPARAAFVTL